MTTVGILSDTHNLLRPEAVQILSDSDLIIHAGDIGSIEIINELSKIAPVHAVRGNNDKDDWAEKFPISDVFEVSGKFIYLIHDINEIDLDPIAAEIDVIVSGHSHKPDVFNRDRILFINPGSAGPRRFSLPVAVAKLIITDNNIDAKLYPLNP